MHIPAPTRAESAPVTPSPHPCQRPSRSHFAAKTPPHPNPGPISHRTRRKLGSPFLKAIDSTILIGFVRTEKISHPNPPQRTIKHKSAQPTTQHPAPARDARLPPRLQSKAWTSSKSFAAATPRPSKAAAKTAKTANTK